jgi:PAS domain S-box-containing protein
MGEMEKFIDASSIVSKADKYGKITYVNDKFSKVSGYTLEEVIGKNHSIVNSGHHPQDFWKGMYKVTIKERGIWNGIVTNKNKSGELYYVDTFIKANFEDDKLAGFTSIRQDVTELKKKEVEIRNRMNAINRSNAVIEFDMGGNVMYANNLFCDIMKYDPEAKTIHKKPCVYNEKQAQNIKNYRQRKLEEGISTYISSGTKNYYHAHKSVVKPI